jgi:hypothetical protein
MKRKAILTFALLFSIAFILNAQQNDPESDFRGRPIGNGKAVEITYYVGGKREIRIPTHIRNLPVTHIGERAFSNKNLTSVIIPNSVTNIGNSAFSYNRLTNFIIPDSVTNIGYNAFQNNQLTSLIIPSGITNISDSAFSSNKLTSLTIPDSVIYIGEDAFSNNQLTVLTIPNSVRNISPNAFLHNRLTSITIGAYVRFGFIIDIGLGGQIHEIESTEAFDDNFESFYKNNQRKAGVYITDPAIQI